jgi:hypothetical protein
VVVPFEALRCESSPKDFFGVKSFVEFSFCTDTSFHFQGAFRESNWSGLLKVPEAAVPGLRLGQTPHERKQVQKR